MEFFELIHARYSYRGEFEPTPVPREHLVKICEAGIQAPSAGNLQSQRFYAVTNPEMLGKIRAIFEHPGIATAPALVLLVSKLLKFGPNDSPFELQDYGAAAQNVLLAIADLGYTTVWTDGQTNFSQEFQDKIKDIVELDEDATVRAVLPVGVPADKSVGRMFPRKPFEELTKFYE
ncbi:MAG: nitroreductase family protein [Oscillospiraceae bacterium]|nr:nitroreductase family protein [Oscillospiraceae bacterium]